MNLAPPVIIPPTQATFYRRARFLLYLGVLIVVSLFIMETLFPTIRFSFDFRSSGATRNPLLDPRQPDGTLLDNGRLEAGNALITNLAALGKFSEARAQILFEKDSSTPANMSFAILRSYRSFFYPLGDPLESFPAAEIYRIENNYYEFRGGSLYPYVSENAFLSRYPRQMAIDVPLEFLERFPIAEMWLGFRPGTLLSFADGVFVVTSDTQVRPIGSADIFLGLGYRFEDVIPASAEEVGIYERGRIFLLGAPHPDGTLFLDTDSQTHYLIEGERKRALTSNEYLDFLLGQTAPILVSSRDLEKTAHCTLESRLFGRGLGCAADLSALSSNLGNDYEVRLSGNTSPVEINRLTTVALKTSVDRENLSLLLSKIKNRILARFGYAQ